MDDRIKRLKTVVIQNKATVLGVIALLGIFSAALVIQAYYLRTSFPLGFISTDSMEPTYTGYLNVNDGSVNPLKGDILIFQQKTVQIGDLIAIDLPDRADIIVHRVINTKQESGQSFYLTKGDNNPWTDSGHMGLNFGWVSQEYVLGVAILAIPGLGGLVAYMQTPFVILSFIVLLLIFLALAFVGKTNQEGQSGSAFIVKKGLERIFSSTPRSRRMWEQTRITLRKLPRIRMIGVWLISGLIIAWGLSSAMFFLSGQNSVILTTTTGSLLPDSVNVLSTFINNVEYHSKDNKTLYVYNILLSVTSHGFFNWIREVIVRTELSSLNGTEAGVYRWTINFDHAGTKVVKAAIIAENPFRAGGLVTDLTIIVDVISHGFFAQRPFSSQISLKMTKT